MKCSEFIFAQLAYLQRRNQRSLRHRQTYFRARRIEAAKEQDDNIDQIVIFMNVHNVR